MSKELGRWLTAAASMVAAVGMFVGPAESASKDGFTLCTETAEMPPYQFGSGGEVRAANPGILIELTRAAGLASGLEVAYLRRPWKRCLALLKQNKVDGLFASIYLPEREELGRYPMRQGKLDNQRRLWRSLYPLFTHAESGIEWDGQTFGAIPQAIAAPLGYVVVKKLHEEFGVEAVTVHEPVDGLRLVGEGRLGAYIIDINIGKRISRKLGMADRIIPLDPPFAQYDWHVMISHGFYARHPDLAEAFWDNLAVVREAEKERLLKAYESLP